MGVLIQSPQLDMELKIIQLQELYIHEEIIPKALNKLKQELLSQQVLKHPILVDSKTLVVLDGMHRVAALRSLGYHLIPVCLVDYQNPAIELFAWYRVLNGLTPLPELIEALNRDLKLELSSLQLEDAIEIVNKRSAFAALASRTSSYILRSESAVGIKQNYDEIALVEQIAQQMKYSLSYSTESDALEKLQNNQGIILIVPSLNKEEVVKTALQGKLFIQKTTRHVVPARPLFVNIPLQWLRESDFKAVNSRMNKLLTSKRIVRRGPGAVIEGRRYEECAYIFED
jgi:hypothetical protein